MFIIGESGDGVVPVGALLIRKAVQRHPVQVSLVPVGQERVHPDGVGNPHLHSDVPESVTGQIPDHPGAVLVLLMDEVIRLAQEYHRLAGKKRIQPLGGATFHVHAYESNAKRFTPSDSSH